jgi:hypothetical protein
MSRPVGQGDASADAWLMADMPLIFQNLEMMLHYRRGADMTAMEDVPDCRWISLPVYEFTDEVQDLLSPLRCLGHAATFKVPSVVQMYY